MTDTEITNPPVSPDDKLLSIREAARQLSNWRKEKNAQPAEAQPEPAAEPTPDSAEPADTAPQEEAPPEPSGETPEELEPTEAEPESPIEPPGSWTAEEQERFAQLPRELQEYIATREEHRDAEVRRRQNEVVDQQRQTEALAQRIAQEQQALQQARMQYEQALPALLQTLQSNGEFADIQSYADVERLAKDDWPRFNQYQAHLMKVQAVQQEVQQAQQRQGQEHIAAWQNYAAQQDAQFARDVPEFADPEKAKQLQEMAIQTLEKDYGFTLQEMQAGWVGAFRDHRVQRILLDAARYRQLKRNPPKPVDKSLPPVQRPGVARGREDVQGANIKALDQKLDRTGSIKDAAKLLTARRTGRR